MDSKLILRCLSASLEKRNGGVSTRCLIQNVFLLLFHSVSYVSGERSWRRRARTRDVSGDQNWGRKRADEWCVLDKRGLWD